MPMSGKTSPDCTEPAHRHTAMRTPPKRTIRLSTDSATISQPSTTSSKKRFLLAASSSITPYIYHSHRTPVSMANPDHPYKKARFVFDSSLRPLPWCMAINDWTSEDTEPQLHFPQTFYVFLVWIWNLRISYPDEEIYPSGDAGAFRHGKYHPNLVGMHIVIIFGLTIMMTGMTFGDNTSPSNWEPIARARSQHAQHLWKNDPTLISRAAAYTPAFSLAPPPTPEEIAGFARAYADTQHTGVFNEDGSRKPPPFPHHINDNLYTDIAPYIRLTIAVAVLSLYVILSYPSPRDGDVLSHEKLQMFLNHLRAPLNRAVDTRRLTVGLTAEKRSILVDHLAPWL